MRFKRVSHVVLQCACLGAGAAETVASAQQLQQQKGLIKTPACQVGELQTDRAGRYAITHIPPGTYQIKAKQVTVPEQCEVRVDFEPGITNLQKY